MIAYKFLASGRVAQFSGCEWPEEGWLEAEQPLVPCRTGMHACRIEDLPYWLGPELWEVELGGEVLPGELKLVAERGRLRRRIEKWDEEARSAFADECVRRVAKHAADELRDAGLDEESVALAAAQDLDAIAAAADAAAKAAEA